MSLIKRIIALAGVISILSVFAASCHKKNESAMKIGDVDITGSLYLAFLIQADMEAQSKLSTQDSSGNSSLPQNYRKESIDGKSYSTWIKESVMNYCQNYALTEKLFKEYKLKFTSEEKSIITYYAQQYWYSYSYQALYEANGISFSTYEEIMTNNEKKSKIFNYYYDTGGTKEVPESDKKEALEKLYVLANTLEISFSGTDDSGNTTTMTDEEKTEKKKELEGYLTRLNKNEPFETVKKDFDAIYNPPEEEEEESTSSDSTSSEDSNSSDTSSDSSSDTSSDTSSGDEEEEENTTPMDENATAYGSSESQSTSTAAAYEKIFEMKAGEKKIIELDDKVILAIRKNILEDPYYFKYYNAEVLSFLKNDEFVEDFTKQAGKLKISKHSFVMNLYKPENLIYPQQTQ